MVLILSCDDSGIGMKHPVYRDVMIYLIAGSLLLSVGWLAHVIYQASMPRKSDRRVVQHGFRYISPLMDVELPAGMTMDHRRIPFLIRIEEFVNKQIKSRNAHDISVFYRELHHGEWFSINEETEYNPASMMKVPVMIAWLKRAEKDPHVFKQMFLYDGKKDMSLLQDIRPQHTLTPGQRYTVRELLDFMMRYSDNNATALLYDEMDPKELDVVLDGTDVYNRSNEENNIITAHGYSGFFRILYNATFLNRQMSEMALEILSHEDFPQGISAGVPAGIPVAAKFGEYVGGINRDEKQLHEFGLVYHPGHPYILGIMTKGQDFVLQAEIIRDISKMIYTEVDKIPEKH